MTDEERSKGIQTAHDFGYNSPTMCKFSDFYNDIADSYGFDSWKDLPQDLRAEARRAFDEGRAKKNS